MIRVGTVASGTLAGIAIHGCDWNCSEGMLCGVEGGLAAAATIDALVFHFDDSATWTPTVTPSDGGARVGFAASF